MLSEAQFLKIFHRLRLASYRELFRQLHERDGSLSATEAFSIDVIYLLDRPRLSDFAEYLGISQPNATYKVNSLTAKGYLEKLNPPEDRRTCRLQVTQKFRNYCTEYSEELAKGMHGLKDRFSPEELDAAGRVLDAMIDQLD